MSDSSMTTVIILKFKLLKRGHNIIKFSKKTHYLNQKSGLVLQNRTSGHLTLDSCHAKCKFDEILIYNYSNFLYRINIKICKFVNCIIICYSLINFQKC